MVGVFGSQNIWRYLGMDGTTALCEDIGVLGMASNCTVSRCKRLYSHDIFLMTFQPPGNIPMWDETLGDFIRCRPYSSVTSHAHDIHILV